MIKKTTRAHDRTPSRRSIIRDAVDLSGVFGDPSLLNQKTNMTDEEKDQAVECAMQVAKYAFMLAFSMSFPNDQALIAHNKENLKSATGSLLELGNE